MNTHTVCQSQAALFSAPELKVEQNGLEESAETWEDQKKKNKLFCVTIYDLGWNKNRPKIHHANVKYSSL